jgi:glycosyltransferase involved in cell wall biosynthesis
VMRRTVQVAQRAVSTVPPERIRWMRDPGVRSRVTFIPVGSNVTELEERRETTDQPRNGQRKIVVFGVTSSPKIPDHITASEIEDIAFALTRAAGQVPGVCLDVFGRGSEEAAERFRAAFEGTGVPVCVRGLLGAKEIAPLLREAEALLYVRGHLSTRRTTGIAAISAGLPIVGYEGPETDDSVREAGALLVPFGDREGVARALERVLVEPALQRELRQRNRVAHDRHFSWEVIARQYIEVLSANGSLPTDDRRKPRP